MAKKREKQKRLPGTAFEPPADVKEAAEKYVDVLYQRMEMQKEEDTARATLLTAMKTHKVKVCDLDRYEVTLKHVQAVDKVSVKKKKLAETEE